MPEIKQIVRIINADIPGGKKIQQALIQIKGISYSFSSALCNIMNFEKSRKIGELTTEEVKKIEDIIKDPNKYKLPSYLLNRRRDPETGKDIHVTSANLKLTTEFDVKKLKSIKSYRGIRHAQGLPVRGQRTRSNFRKGKAVGVSKKKMKEAAPKKEESKKGDKK
ncbi:MAG: 30S ribosomal protein S13 [Nanoarchaeota archaeon]